MPRPKPPLRSRSSCEGLPDPVLDQRRTGCTSRGAQGPRGRWVDIDPADRSEVERIAVSRSSRCSSRTGGSSSTRPRSCTTWRLVRRTRRSSPASRRAAPQWTSSSTGSTASGSVRRTDRSRAEEGDSRPGPDRRARRRAHRCARHLREPPRRPRLPLRRVLSRRLRRLPVPQVRAPPRRARHGGVPSDPA